MYVSKTPAVVKALYSSLVWNMPRDNNTVYLTFDDGPHPDITAEVLTHLRQFDARATFFCIGDNVRKFPAMFEKLKHAGHTTGNHTYNHLNGWKTGDFTYLRNTLECKKLVESPFFRPPYGRITRSQAAALGKKFSIIMWDVLSADFDREISREKCLDNVLRNIQPGSIVVFHDSEKAAGNMLYALPRTLAFIAEKKWTAAALPPRTEAP